jgi:hypothetical protein
MPYQITLLRLIDSHVHAISGTDDRYTPSIPQLYTSLINKVLSYIKSSLAASSFEPSSQLPAVAEGLVLVAQCLQDILLKESEKPPSAAEERPFLRCIEQESSGGERSIELTIGKPN